MSYGRRFSVATIMLVIGLVGHAAPVADNTPTVTATLATVMARLSPKLQKLLSEEMIAINTASQKIVVALVSGDSVTVAKQAQGIHDSFILEKQLSNEDREALEQALPQDFLALDTLLHSKAQQLANVARRGDLELADFYFGRMIETCQACHSRFAAGKFPGYALSPAQGGKNKQP